MRDDDGEDMRKGPIGGLMELTMRPMEVPRNDSKIRVRVQPAIKWGATRRMVLRSTIPTGARAPTITRRVLQDEGKEEEAEEEETN